MNYENDAFVPSPISVLKAEVESLIEHLTKDFPDEIKDAIRLRKIVVGTDISPIPIKTPSSKLDRNEILLQDTFLSYLWCCSYTSVGLNSINYEMLTRKPNQEVVQLQAHPDFLKLTSTLGYGRSLRDRYDPWPITLGRPDVPGKWIEDANNLFLASTAYLFLHELGHLILHKHLSTLMASRRDPFYVTSPEDKERIYNAEVEADKFALDNLIGKSTDDQVILMKYLGAVVAHLSNLYLLDTPDTRGGSHPDLDVRLRSVRRLASLKKEENEIQFGSHISLGMQLFFAIAGRPLEAADRRFDTYEDIENYMFSLIDEMKDMASI